MRMSDLIENCEYDLEETSISKGGRCPTGFRRDLSNNRCVPVDTVDAQMERRKAVRSQMRKNSANVTKKPSLVDRMKSMFGKK